MRWVTIEPDTPDPKLLAEAVRVLEKGGLVAFPTETVYGLCVDATNQQAFEQLYAVKQRRPEKASAFLLPEVEAVSLYADALPPLAQRIADRLWPGPVTLVVPGRQGGMVGLRLPSTVLPRSLALAYKRPLVQTSANLAGEPAALSAAGVARSFGQKVDLILDGGKTPGGRSSTVVQCDDHRFSVLRPGAVSETELIRAATDLILIACTGNLCRSPMAEAMLRRDLADLLECGVSELVGHGYRVGSFGTMAMVGKPASQNSVVAARELDLDITRHRSRPFSITLLGEARRVYCAARGHREFLAPYFRDRPEALELLDPKSKDIHDPYGRSLKVYRKAAELLRKACRARARELLDAGGEEESEQDQSGA